MFKLYLRINLVSDAELNKNDKQTFQFDLD